MAERRRQWVEYRVDGRLHRGCVIHAPDATAAPRPLVMVVPSWLGITEHSLAKAEAALGAEYVLFVADIYGVDAWPKDAAEAGPLVRGLYGDRSELRRRVAGALAAARAGAEQWQADARHVAAIGFCFGGATVLELARSGADVVAVASFHGALVLPSSATTPALRARILVLHGDADPSIPPEHVRQFEAEMREAQADWQLVSYGGVVHSFTNPLANTPGRGLYSPRATRDGFRILRGFLNDSFAGLQ